MSWFKTNALNLYVDDPEKVEHLMRLEGAKERLKLFKADLIEEGSFDSAISGCHGVFHTASPVNFNVKDPQVPHSLLIYYLPKLIRSPIYLFLLTENVIRQTKMNPNEAFYKYACLMINMDIQW